MTHHVVMIVSRSSEPSLLPYALVFALCVIGFAWTVLELMRRAGKVKSVHGLEAR